MPAAGMPLRRRGLLGGSLLGLFLAWCLKAWWQRWRRIRQALADQGEGQSSGAADVAAAAEPEEHREPASPAAAPQHEEEAQSSPDAAGGGVAVASPPQEAREPAAQVAALQHEEDSPDAAGGRVAALPTPQALAVCLACGKGGAELLRCSRCRSVRFCSVACQRAAWKDHKADCVRWAQDGSGSSSSAAAASAPPKARQEASGRTGAAATASDDWPKASEEARDREVETSEELGARLFEGGRYREALEAFRHMLSRAKAASLPIEEGRAHRLIGNALDKLRAPAPEVDEEYRLALKAAHAHNDMELSFNALTGMASHALRDGDADMAEHHYYQALTLAQRTLPEKDQAVAEANLAMCLARNAGTLADSFSHFRQALKLAAPTNNRAVLHANFASALRGHGQQQEALKEYKEALKLAREAGNGRVEVNVLMNLANFYDTELGQAERARECRERLAALGNGQAGSGTEQCAVCLEPLEANGKANGGSEKGAAHRPVATLPCRHAYHEDCWRRCVDVGGREECPLCRDPLSFCAR